VSFEKIDKLGTSSGRATPGTQRHPDHAHRSLRAWQGQVLRHEYWRPANAAPSRFPLLLTTGRILSQYNVVRRRAARHNIVWHDEDRLNPPGRCETRGIKTATGSALQPRRRYGDACPS